MGNFDDAIRAGQEAERLAREAGRICPFCQAANLPGCSPIILLESGLAECCCCSHTWPVKNVDEPLGGGHA